MAAFLHFFCFSLLIAISNAHNITDILSKYPEYSEFNKYLSETKLDGEINSRQTITVLVLTNGPMDALAGKHPLSVIKRALSLLVLLDYFDVDKLRLLDNGTALTTSLYQTTGNADGNLGHVNITDFKGGKVGFASAAPGSKFDSTYTKSVEKIEYSLSILEISAPIIAPGLLTAPAPTASDLNITALLEKAGCKVFAGLLVQTGVLKVFQTAADKGLTIFAPNDEAFKAAKLPDLSKLTNVELNNLLEYHAIGDYSPAGSLKTETGLVSTLATGGAGKFDLDFSTAGDSVTVDTGVNKARVASTIIDATPLVIFTVDAILLPAELFGKAPSPAPGPAPVTSPSPSPSPLAPSSSESPLSPSPSLSPPAPPKSSPSGAPSEGPASDSADSTADKAAAGHVKVSVYGSALLTVSVSLILCVLLS